MSGSGAAIAARARSLVGRRFRPQGRDPMLGLDCVGTAAAALGARGVPADYAPRGQALERIEAGLAALGCREREAPEAGDVIVCRPARDQYHLLVCVGDAFVHADAGLRRIVERPMPPPWPVAGVWRLEAGGK
jgi:lipoprotein Spr